MFEIMDHILKQAVRLGALESEVFVSDDDYFGNLIDDSHVSLGAHRHWRGAGIRVIARKDNGYSTGFSYTSCFDEEAIDRATRRALSLARSGEPNSFFGSFPAESPRENISGILDEKLRNVTPDQTAELSKRLADVRNEAQEAPTILGLLRMGFSKRHVMNTCGLQGWYERSLFLAEIRAVIGSTKPRILASEPTVDWKYNEDLAVECARKAIKWASMKKDPRPLDSPGKTSVIIGPLGLTRLVLRGILQRFRADSFSHAAAGRSAFQQIADDHMTIVDNPLLPEAAGSRPFDDEGVSCRVTTLVEKGMVSKLMYNHYVALRDGVRSTGNAFRGDYKGEQFAFMLEPHIGPTNLILQSTTTLSSEEMIHEMKRGVLVKDFSPVPVKTGRGLAFPFLDAVCVENGEIKHALKNGMLCENPDSLFLKIEALSRDVQTVILPGYMVAAPCIITGSALAGDVLVSG